MKVTRICRIINSVNQEINSLFQIQIHTPIYLISGMLFMEKTMEQIYRKEFPHGSHSVYGEYGINRDLVLSSYHYGSDVEDFWGKNTKSPCGLIWVVWFLGLERPYGRCRRP